ncbi:MAG: MFS transporter [Shimia sp.]
MRFGLIVLTATYTLSQFYRAFLAALALPLEAELGVSAAELSRASGIWFLAFALSQLPVGWALDTIGPRRTAGWALLIGGAGGAALFAVAQGPLAIAVAMGLIGVGCSPILMASTFILAKEFAPVRFATLMGLVIAVGNLGNLGASVPLTMAVEAFGWRGTMTALAVVTAFAALCILLIVRDPARGESFPGSVLGLLRIPALWLIFAVMTVTYAPAAGLRGLWVAPYLNDTFGSDAQAVGWTLLAMSLGMIAGSAVYGPIERWAGTRKWVVAAGSLGSVTCCFAMAYGMPSYAVATLFLVGIGLFGSSFAVIMAHAKTFFPAHLTGRGMTLLNLFGIGGVGVMQSLSGPVYEAAPAGQGYTWVFLLFGGGVLLGLCAYVFSRER